MRFRSLGFVMPACLCGALMIGCAGAGSSATRAAGALPAAGPQDAGRRVRQPRPVTLASTEP